jgi:ribose 5-phosphate isomerase B
MAQACLYNNPEAGVTNFMHAKLAIANDHAGVALKHSLIEHLRAHAVLVRNLGTDAESSVDYPDFSDLLVREITSGNAEFGVLICGSGIGMSIAANRHPNIRAALCRSTEDARLARAHNNANVLVLGARITNEQTARACLDAFLHTAFEGGRHQTRVKKLG